MSTALPFFKCYTRDFLDDAERMSNELLGAYFRMLLRMYQEGKPIENARDHPQLYIGGTRRVFDRIVKQLVDLALVTYEGGVLSNSRAEAELLATAEARAKMAAGGRKSRPGSASFEKVSGKFPGKSDEKLPKLDGAKSEIVNDNNEVGDEERKGRLAKSIRVLDSASKEAHTVDPGKKATDGSQAELFAPLADTPDTPDPGPKVEPADPIRLAVDRYNEAAARHGWSSGSTTLSTEMRKKIGSRIKDVGLDGWNAMLTRAERSSKLTGGESWFTFRPNLPWIAGPKNFEKVASGFYDNPPRKPLAVEGRMTGSGQLVTPVLDCGFIKPTDPDRPPSTTPADFARRMIGLARERSDRKIPDLVFDWSDVADPARVAAMKADVAAVYAEFEAEDRRKAEGLRKAEEMRRAIRER